MDDKPTIESVFVQALDNHQRYSATGTLDEDLRFAVLALTGEAGELANFVKKQWRDRVDYSFQQKLKVADVCAYAFLAAQLLGLTPDMLLQIIADKQQLFVAKMQAQHA